MRWRAPKLGWQYWAGVGFFLLVVLSIIVGIGLSYASLSDKQTQPMSKLYILGQRHYVLDSELQRALASMKNAGNFFTLDVNEVKNQLEALAWVDKVTVRKLWPDKLRVALQEQQVVARWNQAALLNRRGEIFDAPAERVRHSLVSLSGPDDEAQRVLQAYLQMTQQLARQGLALSTLSLSGRHAWSATLSNGVELKIGQEDRQQRVERFLMLYPQLNIEAMRYIDLRYDTGFAVGWKEQQGL